MKHFASLTAASKSASDSIFKHKDGAGSQATFANDLTTGTIGKFKATVLSSAAATRPKLVKDAPSTGNKIAFKLVNRKLVIRGTNNNDNLVITKRGNNIGFGSARFQISKVSQIVISGHGGDDTISIGAALNVNTVIYGGSGNDTVLGGAGRDIVYGGRGADNIRTRGGNDLVYGGAEVDTMSGGGGTNRMRQHSPRRTYNMNSLERQILTLTNRERTSRGLPALRLNPELAKGAIIHSLNMKKRMQQTTFNNGFDHDLWGVVQPTFDNRADFVGFDWSSIRENIAAGQTSASEVVTAWMNSSGHRANILATDIESLGIGVTNLPDGTPIYTQFFGTEV